MKKAIVLAVVLAAMTGCMSENKAWMRVKEIEATKQNAGVSVTGPATLELKEGGKATFGNTK